MVNRQITLAARPEGFPTESDFALVEGDVPSPGAGEVLVRSQWLSVDPYMRGRMSTSRSYAKPTELGEPMTGQAVGEVVESQDGRFAPGDLVLGQLGWQDYAVARGGSLRKLDPALAPPQTALHVLGATGLTAYFGLFDVGEAKPGDAVVVSAAAGAVGQIVGQLAKIAGCGPIVGLAGSPEKVSDLTELYGYDVGIDYKQDDINGILKEVCPLCVATYVAVIGVFVISGGAKGVPMAKLPGRALADMGVLFATPVALAIAILFIAGASWGMSAFPREEERPVVQQLPMLEGEQRAELERWWELQTKPGNFPYPADGAKVQIVEFADFQCPHCRQMYFSYKPILDRYLAEHPNDVKFVFKNWPINSRCNPTIPGINFPDSCNASAAYLMAKQKGAGEKMKDWLFAHQAELTASTIKRAAADIGQVPDFDAQYPNVLTEIQADAKAGTAIGVNGTPAFFINGRRIPGAGVAPQLFDTLIDLELKKAK